MTALQDKRNSWLTPALVGWLLASLFYLTIRLAVGARGHAAATQPGIRIDGGGTQHPGGPVLLWLCPLQPGRGRRDGPMGARKSCPNRSRGDRLRYAAFRHRKFGVGGDRLLSARRNRWRILPLSPQFQHIATTRFPASQATTASQTRKCWEWQAGPRACSWSHPRSLPDCPGTNFG